MKTIAAIIVSALSVAFMPVAYAAKKPGKPHSSMPKAPKSPKHKGAAS